MSFWKKLFGGGAANDSQPGVPKVLGEDSYKGFTIRAIEMKAGSEFQLCGEIEKEVDGEVQVKQFIRADKLSSETQVSEAAINKGKQIIDEQGDAVFNGGGW